MGGDHAHPVDAAAVERARARLPGAAETARLTRVLAVMADPTRSRVLQALDTAEELCVGDLALALGSTQDAVGYSLRVLRGAGLVRPRRDGRVVYYRLADGFPEPLREHCLRRLAELAPPEPADGGSSTDDDGAPVVRPDAGPRRR